MPMVIYSAPQVCCRAGNGWRREIWVAQPVNKLLIALRLTLKQLRFLCLIVLGAISAILFSSCGTTAVALFLLTNPQLRNRISQTVHTTAYTHAAIGSSAIYRITTRSAASYKQRDRRFVALKTRVRQ